MHPQRPLPLHRRLNRPLMRSVFCRPAASEAMPPPQAVRRRAIVTRASRSRARLISATNSRRFVAKPRTPHPIPQAAQLFKCRSANVRGRGARPLVFLSGVQGGYSLSRKRVSPLIRAAPSAAPPLRAARGTLPVSLFRETKSPRRERRGLLAVLCVYF